MTVIGDNITITYGASVPIGSITYNGLVNGDSPGSLTAAPTLSSAQSGILNAGTYAGNYTVSGGVSNNYNFAYADGNLAVQKRSLTVTTYGQTISLGAPEPVFTGANDLIAQDVPLISWSYAPVGYSGAVGFYPIAASFSDPNSRLANYNASYIDGTFAVLPATSAQIPSTVLVTSQNPTTTSSPYARPNGGSAAGSSNGTSQVGYFSATSMAIMTKAFGPLDLEIAPALQEQLGYAAEAN